MFVGLQTLFPVEEINIGDNFYDDLTLVGIALFSVLIIFFKG